MHAIHPDPTSAEQVQASIPTLTLVLWPGWRTRGSPFLQGGDEGVGQVRKVVLSANADSTWSWV